MKYFMTLFFVMLPSVLYAHGIPEADRLNIINGGYIQYVILGAKHMVTGYDHILFLIGVLFFLTKFTDILKFVTMFTLGHSITLILGTFLGVQVNYWFIDSIIALTVIYKAYENIDGFKGYKLPNISVMVFVFGLIHGLGLSTRLQQLPLSEFSQYEMFMRIVSFNIGVEFGQILVLTAIIPFLIFWKTFRTFEKQSMFMNKFIILIGIGLFTFQFHGLMHHVSVDELKFSEDSHSHSHNHSYIEPNEDMDERRQIEIKEKEMEKEFKKRN